jgi:hypothetical protein
MSLAMGPLAPNVEEPTATDDEKAPLQWPSHEIGRFWGVWKPRLMRAVMVRLTGLSLQSPTGTPSRTTHPPESPALHTGTGKRSATVVVTQHAHDSFLNLRTLI